jgi:hypothetical protein
MKNFFKTICLLLLLGLIGLTPSTAQLPSGYLCSLRNDSLLSGNIYEFDIYIQNTDNTKVFELSVFQASIAINSLIKNTGIINANIIAGSSQLSSCEIPATVLFSNTQNCIQLAPKAPPGFTHGTVIPTTSPGIRICRVRLTNTLNYGQARPNLSFIFSGPLYRSIIGAYDQQTGVNTDITNQNYFSTTLLTNPLLNTPVSLYAVSGSGHYCEGSLGRVISLSGSQPEVKYQLKNNGINKGEELNGTGSPLQWINNTAGNYKINARRTATFISSMMSDSANIVMDSTTIGGVVTGGTTISFGAYTDTLRLISHRGSVITWQKQLNGGGYTDISSSSGLLKYIEIPSSPGTWEYRCIVQNGICGNENSVPTTVIVSAIPLTRYWTGSLDENWNKTNNWNPSGIPSAIDNLIIPGSMPHMPVVNNQGYACNDLNIMHGALVTINSGITLTVYGNLTLNP